MGWFQKKAALNNVSPSMCNPIIVNQTNHSLVVFLDRGVLYNKQILEPGEAVAMTRKDTAGIITPYKIHAVIGDQKALPTRMQSTKNLVSTAAIPTAFIIGTLVAASSAGTLTGPSSALGRVAGGIVVRGMVIDSTALAAGSLTASRAAVIADKLIEKHPENFSAKSSYCMPGQRYVLVRGGIETPLTLTTVTEKKFREVPISGECKVPMDTLRDKVEFFTPSIFRISKKQGEGSEESLAIEASTDSGASPSVIEAAEEVSSSPPAIEHKQSEKGQLCQTLEQSASSPESEYDRELREALAQSASATAHESKEDRELRMAIEESLKMEDNKSDK